MGFNRDVIRRRRDEMHELGVRVRWAGRRPRLWRSVIKELEIAEELTRDNDVLTLTMCVNYGGRAEIADAAAAIAREVAAGRLNPDKVDESTVARFLDEPDMPDVDLFVAQLGREPDEQLPALAVGLRRVRLPRHPLARLRPPAPVGGVRGVRLASAPVRQRLSVARAVGRRRAADDGGVHRPATSGVRDGRRTAHRARGSAPAPRPAQLGAAADDPGLFAHGHPLHGVGAYGARCRRPVKIPAPCCGCTPLDEPGVYLAD